MPLPLSWPRVYVAGPDVFLADAAAHLQGLAQTCEAHGLRAVLPSDDQAPAGQQLAAEELARQIYRENMKRLRSAHGVIANLSPFRGIEPDSGTVFEVGVAVALGLPVVAYGVPAGSYADRVPTTRTSNGVLQDTNGLLVEDFGLPMNLMLACSVKFERTPEDAARALAAEFARRGLLSR